MHVDICVTIESFPIPNSEFTSQTPRGQSWVGGRTELIELARQINSKQNSARRSQTHVPIPAEHVPFPANEKSRERRFQIPNPKEGNGASQIRVRFQGVNSNFKSQTGFSSENARADFRFQIPEPKPRSRDLKLKSKILGWRQADYRIPNSNPKSQGVPL